MRGFLKTDMFGGGGRGNAWLTAAFAATGILAHTSGALAQAPATNYFRPWTQPGFSTTLDPEWTTPPEPLNELGQVEDIDPPGDGNDWVFYVSENGDDDNSGNNESLPLRTIRQAWLNFDLKRYHSGGQHTGPANARIRLMRGSTFKEVLTPPSTGSQSGWLYGGKGPTEPLVIEAWPYPEGNTPVGPRPRVAAPVDIHGEAPAPVFSIQGGVDNIWVIGIELTYDKIPAGSFATGNVPVSPKEAIIDSGFPGSNLLFEDLYIHDVSSAFSFDGHQPGPFPGALDVPGILGLTIRRCIVERTWNRNMRPGFGHPQGSDAGGGYIGSCKWALIEENTMDQVGWSHLTNHPLITQPTFVRAVENPEGLILAPKTVFNQGFYIPASSENVLVRNNIVSRPSHCAIQLRGNSQRAENNLVLGAPVGISLGHAQNQGQPNNEYRCTSFPSGQCPCDTTPLCDGRTQPCAHYEKFWHGQCAYNVILNGANIDRWVYVEDENEPGQFQTTEIWPDQDVRGRGITISRCRMTDRNGATFNYCEKTKPTLNVQTYTCESVKAGEVFRNLIANNEDGREAGGAGIYSDDDQASAPNPDWIVSYQAYIHDNIVYNWLGAKPEGSLAVNILNGKTNFDPLLQKPPFCAAPAEGPLGSQFRFVNNHFIQDDEYGRVAAARWNPVNVNFPPSSLPSWDNNLYYSKRQVSEQFLVQLNSSPDPSYGQSPAPFASWQAASNETTTSMLTSPPSYPDPTRNLYTYMQFELGVTPTSHVQDDVVTDFMALCATQARGSWNKDLTAEVVNAYMRGGFGVVMTESGPCQVGETPCPQ